MVVNSLFDEKYLNMLYDNIFKSKSYHLFRNNKTKGLYKDSYHITKEEIIINTLR